MAYVVARGNVWWIRYKVAGKWTSKPTEFRVTRDADGKPTSDSAKRNAKRLAKRKQERADAGAAISAPTGPLTVRGWADPWIVKRREANLDWTNDRGRLEHHVLPVIGDMLVEDVRARHIAELVHQWRFVKKLAQRTVYNIYSTIAAMFRDAAIAGEIEQTPCILTNAQLGPLVDKDPEWRDNAVFTRDEAETLISDERIPMDRRIYYAFMLLAGLRPGEVSAGRWRHYDATVAPLGKLTVAKAYNTRKHNEKGTKTNAVRHVPVHPTLAAMLAEWRLSGWAAMMGRQPELDDLIVPLPPADAASRRSRTGEAYRGHDYAGKRWRNADLKLLGWREREMYAMKSTFITLAIDDGADPEIIEHRVTHARAKRSAFDGYDRGPHWESTCSEIAKLKLRRVTPRVTVLKIVRGSKK